LGRGADFGTKPGRALSDGFQALTFGLFRHMMDGCRTVAAALGRTIG
jgi:3-deoxy-D-arabino-heptulosonate 7-phosphate (DAHP) synthase